MLRKLWFNLAYYQKPTWDTGVSPKELINFIETHTPGKALDLGCGTGTNAITLAKSGWQVTGLDFAPRAIRIAKKKTKSNGVKVKLLVEDVTHLDSFLDCFELILDMGCFQSIPQNDQARYISSINRLLTPNGTYLLYVFFKDHANAKGPGVTEADIANLARVLKLTHREDGTERGMRVSAWLYFTKPD